MKLGIYAIMTRYKKPKTKMQTTHHPLLHEADKLKLSGEHDSAIALCNKLLCTDLDYVEAYEEIGDNYLSLREYAKAKKALNYALKLKPTSANALYLLGFLHSSQGNFERSIQTLEQANHSQPNHPEILRCLGWSTFHNGERDRGLVILERAHAMAPRDTLIMCDLAVCYLNKREFNRTIDILENALQIDPNNVKALDCLETAKFFKREFSKLKGKK